MQISNGNLEAMRDEMLKLLSLAGYSPYTVKKYRRVFKEIFSAAQSGACTTYEEVFQKRYRRECLETGKEQLREARWIIGAIGYYDAYGLMPNGVRRTRIGKVTGFDLLSEEFKSILNRYKEEEPKRGIKTTTVKVSFSSGTTFFAALQARSITELSRITPESVIDVFTGEDGKPNKSSSYKKNLVAVFRACRDFFPDGVCDRIISFLPEIRDGRKNIQYLNEEEAGKLRDVLLNEQGGLSKRDRAIGLLAMYTGLRSCDIAELSFDDIDWVNDTLSIVQQKTGKPLTLPLSATVGNALYDYIHGERPEVRVQEVFVTKRIPFRRITSGGYGNIASVIMKYAGIRTKEGDRKGFHLFRHHLATEMLSHDVPVTIISEVLGHSSPNSTQTYLSADFYHIKACSLSIEGFPTRKGVLS